MGRPSTEVPIEKRGDTIAGYVAARRSISATISASVLKPPIEPPWTRRDWSSAARAA
jgi:hypothetical protein